MQTARIAKPFGFTSCAVFSPFRIFSASVASQFQLRVWRTRTCRLSSKPFSSFFGPAAYWNPLKEHDLSRPHLRSFKMKASQEELLESYRSFPSEFNSVILSTTSVGGDPNSSYAPCVIDQDRNIYIFASGLALHTRNMHETGKVSTLFIEDESKVSQIFARKRLSYDCVVHLMDRGTEEWNTIAQKFSDRFGSVVQVFKDLEDFRLFKLQPKSGRFVVGFGDAYRVDPDDIGKLLRIRGNQSGNANAGN